MREYLLTIVVFYTKIKLFLNNNSYFVLILLGHLVVAGCLLLQSNLFNTSGGSKISRRGRPLRRGVPTTDAAVFRKICMLKRKNR